MCGQVPVRKKQPSENVHHLSSPTAAHTIGLYFPNKHTELRVQTQAVREQNLLLHMLFPVHETDQKIILMVVNVSKHSIARNFFSEGKDGRHPTSTTFKIIFQVFNPLTAF